MGCLQRGAAAGCLALVFGLAACGPERMPFDQDANAGDAGGMDSTSPPADVGNAGDARRCARQQDCDDNIPCTEDACVIGGVCENVPNDRLCPGGDGGAAQRCFAGRGCALANSCTSNADCDDRVACTRDVCVAGGACQNIRDDSRCTTAGEVCSVTLGCVARGRCGTDPDCDDSVFCNGPERCVSGMCAAGTAPNCADTDPCTADLCSEAMRMCSHPPVSPCGGMVAPGTYDLMPPVNYSCGAGGVTVNSVTLSMTGSGVSVAGFPVTLNGPAPSMGMFTATGMESRGGCQWTYNLSGSFTMARQFRGTWNVSFDFCSASLRCLGGFGEVTGMMR